MGGRKKSKPGSADDQRDVWAKIVSHRSNYFISRHGSEDDCMIDDEAELEIIATIDAITPSHRKYIGQEMVIALLAAEKYVPNEPPSTHFFGSVNLRQSQRSALAYLPSAPFWALPRLIGQRDAWVRIGWTFMRRGNGHLTSVFIGDEQDRSELLELGGNRLAVAD